MSACEACKGFEPHNSGPCGKEATHAVRGVYLCGYHAGTLERVLRLYLADGRSIRRHVANGTEAYYELVGVDDVVTDVSDALDSFEALAAHVFATPNGPTGPAKEQTGMSTNPDQHQKKDAGKVPHELLPEDALEQVARVLAFGARKYRPRGWEDGIEYSRVYGAIKRHGKAWFQDREELDPETGLSHLAHLACEVLFVLAFHMRGADGGSLDDRPRVKRFDEPAGNEVEVELGGEG